MSVNKSNVAFMYRSGGQWVLSFYWPECKSYIDEAGLGYHCVCRFVRLLRRQWNTRLQCYVSLKDLF